MAKASYIYRQDGRFTLSGKNLLSVIVLVVMVLSLPVSIFMLKRTSFLSPKASGNGANFYFAPDVSSMPPDLNYKVMLDAGTNSIGFVRIVIKYDYTKVQLTGDVVVTDSFKTVVSKTAFTDANKTGSVVLVVALSPGDTAPTGIFQLAGFTLTPISPTTNDVTSLTLDANDVQVVNLTAVVIPVTSQPASITLNPVVTLTPQTTAAPSGVPSSYIPVVLTSTLPSAKVGRQYNKSVEGYSLDLTKKLTLTVAGLPTGLFSQNCKTAIRKLQQVKSANQVNYISCQVSGVPVQAGSYSLQVALSDGVQVVYKQVSLVVN